MRPAQYDYFRGSSRPYSHVRTESGVSGGLSITPSPHEYNNTSNTGSNNADHGHYSDYGPKTHPGVTSREFGRDGGSSAGEASRMPIYDKPLPNYKPTALRRPFLLVLMVAVLGAIAGLAVGLVRLPVNKAAIVARRDVSSLTDDADLWRRQSANDGQAGDGSETTLSSPGGSITSIVTTTIGPVDQNGSAEPSVSSQTSSLPQPTVPIENFATDINQVTHSAPGAPAPTDFGGLNDVTQSATGAPAPTDFGGLNEFTVSAPAPTDFGGLNGDPTPTFAVPSSDFGQLVVSSLTTAPTTTIISFVAPATTILTNAAGQPTLTSLVQPPPVFTPVTTVVNNAQGQPTTLVTSKPVPPLTQILTNPAGQPTKTLTSFPSAASGQANNNSSSNAAAVPPRTTEALYVLGMFIPTLVAVLLSIPVRILDINARVFHPWHQLAQPEGALSSRSLSLSPHGWHGHLEAFRVLRSGQWLLFATTMLTLLSALLIPLSTEAIRIDLQGPNCKPGTMTNKGCYFVTTAFMQGTIACVIVLALMAFILLGLAVMLGPKWRTGVAANPSSICGIASLCLHDDVRRLFTNLPTGSGTTATTGVPTESVIKAIFADRRFRLGYFYGKKSGVIEYGVVLVDRDDSGEARTTSEKIGGGMRETIDELWEAENMLKHPQDQQQQEQQMFMTPNGTGRDSENRHHLPFLMLGYAGRLVLLAILLGLLAMVGYYQSSSAKTGFEKFMSGEGFGVRFLFAGAGVAITLSWGSFFDSVAIISPFRLLARSPRPAHSSILLSPPRNGFSGLWAGVRRGDVLLAITSFISICSELLPLFLANTPFRSTQLYIVNRGCTYAGIGVMSVMVIVLAGSFAVKWPSMPLDPSTAAGAMWYVCDSYMVVGGGMDGSAGIITGGGGMSGLSRLNRKERDKRVMDLGMRYGFGRTIGAGGQARIGVDIVKERPVGQIHF